MKNYLILSEDLILIDDIVNDIIKKNKLNSNSVVKYDLTEVPLETLIEELNTYAFFEDKKLVVAYSCSFLSSNKKKNELVQNEKLLEEYINNPNPLNCLVVITDKLDERKKLSKLLREKCEVIEKNLSIEEKIKDRLDGFKMDNKTINYLIDYLKQNNERILTELEKLKMYKYEEKQILIEDIDSIVVKEFDEDVFSLINCILNRNIDNAFKVYNRLISRGEEISKIVITVSDQLRLIYKTKVLMKDGKSRETITSMFKIHPYRVKLAIEYSYNFTFEELEEYLINLGNIDINIKTGKASNNYGFDLFLLGLM